MTWSIAPSDYDLLYMFPPSTKILILDDMQMMRSIIRKMLKDLGFTDVTDVDNGESGLEKIKSAAALGAPFQLIISDWMMPKMAGIDLLRAIRTIAPMKHLPFIMITAESEKELIVVAVQAGVTQYITKPFQVSTLAEKLKLTYEITRQRMGKAA